MKIVKKLAAISIVVAMISTSLTPSFADVVRFDTTRIPERSVIMWDKIIGSNREDTANKIADKMENYDTAVLVNGYSTADGLSASSLAGKENAPIFLVKSNKISKETLSRLRKVKKIYIVGGTGVVSHAIENSLKNDGKSVTRLGGANRIKTSLAVAKEIGNYSKAFIVNGYTGEADAMSVAPIAARDKAPILLTDGKKSPEVPIQSINYYVVGGKSVVNENIKNNYKALRLGGSNRYNTNKLIIERFYPDTKKLYVANGDTLVDALSVSPLAKNDGVMLANKRSDKSSLESIEKIVQVGGMDFAIIQNPETEQDKPNSKPEANKPGKDETLKPNPNSKASLTAKRTTVKIVEGDVFTASLYGFKAYDKNGRDISNQVKITGHRDVNVPGTYNLVAVSGTGSDAISMGVQLIVTPLQKYDLNSESYRRQAKAQFYKRLDMARIEAGLPLVKHKWQSEEYARIKSEDMARKGYIDHSKIKSPHFVRSGECVAKLVSIYNTTSPEKMGNRIFDAWWNSDSHRAVLLHNYHGHDSKYITGMDYYVKDSKVYAAFEAGTVQNVIP